MRVGNGGPLGVIVNADQIRIHKSEPWRRPWVTKPRRGATLEDCIIKISFAEEKKPATTKEVRHGG